MAGREKKPVVATKALGSRREKLLTSTLRKYNSLAEAKKELLRLSQDIDPNVKRPVGRPRKHDLLETCSTSGDSTTSVGPRSGGRLKKRFSRISGGLEANNGVGRNSPYSFRSQGLLRNGKRRTLDGVDFSVVDFGPSRRRRISSLCGSVDDLRPVGRKPGKPPPSSGISSPGSVDSPPFSKAKLFAKKDPVFLQADKDKPGRPSPSSEVASCDDDGSNLGRHISSRIAALIKKSKVSEILQKYTEAKASRKAAAAENEKKLMDTNSNLCAVTVVSGVLPVACEGSVTKENVKVEDVTVSSDEMLGEATESPSDCPVKLASEKFVEYKTEKAFGNPTESATSLSTVPASSDKVILKPGNLCDVPAGGDVAPPLTNKVQDLRVRGNVIKSQKTVGVCNLRKAARKRILKVDKISSVKRKMKMNKTSRKVVNNNQRTNLTAKKLVGSSVTSRKPRNLVSTPFKSPRALAVTKIKTEPLFTNDKKSPDFVKTSDTLVPPKADGDNGTRDSSPPPVVDISVNEFSKTSPVKSETVVSGPCENNFLHVEDIPVCTLNGLVAEVVVGKTKDEDQKADQTNVDSQVPGKEILSEESDRALSELATITKEDAEVNCDVECEKTAPTVVGDAKELFAEKASSKDLICESDHTGSSDKNEIIIQDENVDGVSAESVVNCDGSEGRDDSKCFENGELGSAEAENADEEAVIPLEIVKYLESKSLNLNVVPVVNLEENDQSSESEDGAENLNELKVVECQIPSPGEIGLEECIMDVDESLPKEDDAEIDEILLSPVEDKTCTESEGVATGSAPRESESSVGIHDADEDKRLLENGEDSCGAKIEEAAGNVSPFKPNQDSNSDTSPAQQSKHKSIVRRRRSAAVKDKKQRGCLKRSLSAECTSRDTLENNQRRARSGCESSKAPETTYIIISKEKEADDVNGTDFEIMVSPDKNGSGHGEFQFVQAAANRGDGDNRLDEVVIGEVKTVGDEGEASEAPDGGVPDKPETTETAKAVAEESAEEQAVKESVLRALGLTSWRAAQEAVARQGGSAKNSSLGDGETYTGTLKTVIKVQRSPEKRRRSLKMVLKHCSTRNGASSQIHSHGGAEDGLGGGEHVEYRICKEADTSAGGSGSGFGLGNRKYSKTSQGYRYLSEHDSNSSSSGNAASAEKGVDGSLEPKEDGKSDKSSLVIPEKSASFSIHPGRLCSDVCSYCFGKFGSLDTPCHIAQLKSSDRQRKILETETHLTPDSCLCDACYRHVDRKANCPSYKPTRKRHHRSGSSVGGAGGNACSAVGCEETAQHHVRRKWLLKLKRSISKKVPLDMEKPHPHFPFCQQHFNWIDYYMVCGICSRRLTRSHMYALGGSEVRDLNAALVRDGIPARVSDKRFLCKLCRYYASLRAKCRDPAQLAGNQKMFFESYRKRILQYHDIEVASEPEELPLTIPKPKRKKSKVLLPSTATTMTTVPSVPSAEGTSESSSGAVEEDRLQAGTPMIDYSNLASIGASLTVTPVPAGRAAPRRGDEDELPPVQASFSFHGPGSLGRGRQQGASAEWERCTANLQFTAETKQLFQTLQRPYGSHSSFMRHLVLMEKFWRQGDLVLAPRASARATNYVNSVQHRLRAFDYTPSTMAASSFTAGGAMANSVSVIPVPDPPVSVVELPLRQKQVATPPGGGGGVTLQLGGGVMQLGGKTFLYAQPRPPRKRAPSSSSTVCRISEVRSLAPEQTRWSWGDKRSSSGLQKIAPKVSVSMVPKASSTIVTPTGIVLSRNPEISVSSVPPK